MPEIIIKKLEGQELINIKETLGDFLEGQRGKGGIFRNMSVGYVEHVILPEDHPVTFVAYEGNALVGSASVFTRNQQSPLGPLKSAFVTAVAVSPDKQGQGIGTRLMTAIADDIKANYDAGILFSDVTPLYEKVGFKVVPWFYTITEFGSIPQQGLEIKQGLDDDLLKIVDEAYHTSTRGIPVFPSRERASGVSFLEGLRKAVFKNFRPKESDFLPFNNNCFYSFSKDGEFLGYAYAVEMQRMNGDPIIDVREVAAIKPEEYLGIRDALMHHFNISTLGTYLPPEHDAYLAFHGQGVETTTIDVCGDKGPEPKLFKEYMMIFAASENAEALVKEAPRMGYFPLDEGYFFTPQQLLGKEK